MKLLVPSCNAYRATWEPFRAFLERSWPDCPYELWIASEGDSGTDRGWCSNLLHYLEQIEDEHVLMVLDDHWIDGKIGNPVLKYGKLNEWMSSYIGCFRLHPSPGVKGDGIFNEHRKGVPYRISTAPSIWNVKFLKTIVQGVVDCGFESAQHFEISGSMCSTFTTPWRVLAPREDVVGIPFINSAIVRGKWNKAAIERAAQIGVTVDTEGREIG